MTRWIGERKIMQREFKNALILSSHSHAEGVELSHVEHLIISSLDYSTARYQQRNARQASIKRQSPINVHVLMSAGQVSEAVFKARMFMPNIPPKRITA
jgi:ERCC4-type nuclease